MATSFTTTSAIPISEIDRSSELNGRIIGFHFFNPPTRQQLIELIAPDEMEPELTPLALGIAREMKKKTLFSADVAGFVSNGHFMREIRYACDEAEEMAQEHGVAHAVAIINDVTRDLLVRPMGIFEVMDYVGVGVCRQIGLVMNQFLPGSDFSNDLVDQVAEGPGSFFQYEKRVPKAVYDVDHRAYVPMPRHDWGKLPNWSQLRESRQGRETLQIFFKHLFEELSPQAEIARDYLLESREIAQQLVRDGVARDLEDVNRVLQLGFGHLYGPQNDLY